MTDTIVTADRLREMLDGLDGVTPGPWAVWAERTPERIDAIHELEMQVEQTEPFVGYTYLLDANGKCPATTGCGPSSAVNAAHIARCDPHTMRQIITLALEALAPQQRTSCAVCGEDKHTPLRRDEMGGYVCLTCIDARLEALALRTPSEGEIVAKLSAAVQRLIGRGNAILGYCETPEAIEAGAAQAYTNWKREADAAMALALTALAPSPQPVAEAVAWVTPDILAAMKRGDRAVPGWKQSAEFCIPLYAGSTQPESLGIEVTDEMVGISMQEAWNEICSDTNCHPLDIERQGKNLFFHPAHWAKLTAMYLRSSLQPKE